MGGSASTTLNCTKDLSPASLLGVPHGLHRGQGPCALSELPRGCVGGGERHPRKNKLGKTSQVQIPAGCVTRGQWLPLSDADPHVERGLGFQTASQECVHRWVKVGRFPPTAQPYVHGVGSGV